MAFGSVTLVLLNRWKEKVLKVLVKGEDHVSWNADKEQQTKYEPEKYMNLNWIAELPTEDIVFRIPLLLSHVNWRLNPLKAKMSSVLLVAVSLDEPVHQPRIQKTFFDFNGFNIIWQYDWYRKPPIKGG